MIPVDLYGGAPDLEGIRIVARQHGIRVIEDAAEAVGTVFKGRRAGAWGDVGVFSFHGSKTLTTGEGGMLVTDADEIYERVCVLRDHGRVPGSKLFWNAEVAYKYKMSSLQAALGLAQLERIEELIARKRLLFDSYRRELSDVARLVMNVEPPGTYSSYWMVTVILDPAYGIDKDNLVCRMRDKGIECRPFFRPLSSLPAYAQLSQAEEARRRNVVSYSISPYGINLPSSLALSPEEIHYVAESLKEILRSSAGHSSLGA